jgi:ribosomal protein S12 methylthiotransferase
LILSEARELVASGAVELNIIAQDITAYGRDLSPKISLARLLEELAEIGRLHWIRLLYLYPSGIDEQLIETIGRSEKIVHYFDIPLQHVNPQILKAMRRPHSKDQIRRLIEKLRHRLPDCVLRTTLIAGFPGETDARFKELLDFVRWALFDNLGCFTFYPEAGTPAPVIARINAAMGETMKSAEGAAALARFGQELEVVSAEAFAPTVKADWERYRVIVQASGFKAED